jgi:hypothetical protein
MDENNFWGLIESFDWDKEVDDVAVIQPAVTALADLPVTDIQSFEEILTEQLYALDTKAHARNIGEDAYKGEGEFFSVDQFLYARCVVVANGRELFNAVLTDPHLMPKDMEFEALLWVADRAHQRKTGERLDFHPHLSVETFSNRAGWGSA